jgi:hypothetical protein
MKRRELLVGLAALASGCGGGGGAGGPAASISASQPTSPAVASSSDPLLQKLGVFVCNEGETALVVFGGRVLALSFARPWAGFEATSLRVRDWETGVMLAEHPCNVGMGCAIVKDGVINVFGNTRWENPGNKIVHFTLDPVTFTPSAPIDALLMNSPSDPFKFYNTSVTADPNGFRMVVETTAGVYFARSTDLSAWTFYGGQLNAGQYCGCPTINYINGAHHLTYLAAGPNGTHETRLAKSADDCFTFTYGKALLVASPGEGTNNSDVDMVEIDGKVCGVYLDGDQTTYANLRRWSYDGTLAQMFGA